MSPPATGVVATTVAPSSVSARFAIVPIRATSAPAQLGFQRGHQGRRGALDGGQDRPEPSSSPK